MTRRFKKAVKGVVWDGVITSKENELLDKVAKEEDVSEVEAEIYITNKLKKRKIQIAKGGTWISRNGGVIITGIVTLSGIVLKTVIGEKGKSK